MNLHLKIFSKYFRGPLKMTWCTTFGSWAANYPPLL